MPTVFLYDGRCETVCPSGMMGDTSTYTCVQCGVSNCAECTNNLNCIACKDGYYLNNTTNPYECHSYCGSPATDCTDVHISCPIN